MSGREKEGRALGTAARLDSFSAAVGKLLRSRRCNLSSSESAVSVARDPDVRKTGPGSVEP